MPNLRRSPSLESVSSVRSLESMQSIDSVKSFGNAHSPGGVSVKSSDYGVLNDMDMGRTITSAPVIPAVVDGDVEKSSSMDDGPPNTCDDEREPAPKSTVEPAPLGYRKHDRFYMDSRTIKLVLDDGTLYRVFRQSFAAHSTLFAEEYLVGRGDDQVIKLPGVSSVDLDRFLSLMYPSELATCELFSAQDWISVLRLAHRWSFSTLRARALREIELVSDVVDKIITAREFSDLDATKQWLLPAFTKACTADGWLNSITLEDAERMGASTVLAIARIREDLLGGAYGKREDVDEDIYVAQTIVEAGLAWAPHTPSPMMPAPNDRSVAGVLAAGAMGLSKSLSAHSMSAACPPADGDRPAATELERLSSAPVPLREVRIPIATDDQSLYENINTGPPSELLTSRTMVGVGNDPDGIPGVDDIDLPLMQRAMLALNLSRPKDGESFSELLSRHARVLRSVDSVMARSTLTGGPKDLEISLTSQPGADECLHRVEQRIACLIVGQLMLRRAQEPEEDRNGDGEPSLTILSVTVPKGIKGAPMKRKLTNGLIEQHLTVKHDPDNARVLHVQIPRR
ncbi:hypothetical protein GGF50DRAFT_115801 [Schizophyllum commune]